MTAARLFVLAVLTALPSCRPALTTDATAQTASADGSGLPYVPAVGERVERTEEQWRASLSPEAYTVLRESGTELACSGATWDFHGEGVYHCAGCNAPLFSSSNKFDSGTGWPSYTTPFEPGRLVEVTDTSLGVVRTEVRCASCDGHLGHVFEDGPPPTGLRYCINSVAMAFRPADVDGDGLIAP